MESRQWQGTTFGNRLMHKWLIGLLRCIDIRIVYVFTYIFVIPPCLFRAGFRPIYRYFRQRWGLGPVKAFLKTYQNYCLFSQVVIDRFAMYSGKHFHVDIEGYNHFLSLADQPGAFVHLSSHIGNYELAGYSLVSEKKPFNAIVYGGEKQTVMENRAHMFADKNIHMLWAKEDMSHLFLLDKAIRQGEIISMPADRVFGSRKTVSVSLLGAEAELPQGPFSVATMRALPVLAVNVMKSSTTTYRIYVTPLEYDTQAPRQQQIQQLANGFATELERMLHLYPTQWYNFFDYWKA